MFSSTLFNASDIVRLRATQRHEQHKREDDQQREQKGMRLDHTPKKRMLSPALLLTWETPSSQTIGAGQNHKGDQHGEKKPDIFLCVVTHLRQIYHGASLGAASFPYSVSDTINNDTKRATEQETPRVKCVGQRAMRTWHFAINKRMRK